MIQITKEAAINRLSQLRVEIREGSDAGWYAKESEDGDYVTFEDAWAVLEAALSTLPIAGEGKVKPLEWKPVEDGRFKSGTRPNTFQAEWYTLQLVGTRWHVDDGRFTFLRLGYDTLEAAKAAAQSDYQTRILSAMISSPGKDGGQPWDDPTLDGTDGAHPAWWRGCDYGYAKGIASFGKDGGQQMEAAQNYNCACIHPSQCDNSCFQPGGER